MSYRHQDGPSQSHAGETQNMNRRTFGRMVAGALAAVVAPLGWMRTSRASVGPLRLGDVSRCSACEKPAIGGSAVGVFDGFRDGWIKWKLGRCFIWCRRHRSVLERQAALLDQQEAAVCDANEIFYSRKLMEEEGADTNLAFSGRMPRVEIDEIRAYKWKRYPEWNGTIEGFKGGPNGWT